MNPDPPVTRTRNAFLLPSSCRLPPAPTSCRISPTLYRAKPHTAAYDCTPPRPEPQPGWTNGAARAYGWHRICYAGILQDALMMESIWAHPPRHGTPRGTHLAARSEIIRVPARGRLSVTFSSAGTFDRNRGLCHLTSSDTLYCPAWPRAGRQAAGEYPRRRHSWRFGEWIR